MGHEAPGTGEFNRWYPWGLEPVQMSTKYLWPGIDTESPSGHTTCMKSTTTKEQDMFSTQFQSIKPTTSFTLAILTAEREADLRGIDSAVFENGKLVMVVHPWMGD